MENRGAVTVKARLGVVAVALIACMASVAVTVSYAGTRSGPVVTLIDDSVADGLEHNPVALDRLNRDFTLNLQTQGCRRLATRSCTIVGEPAPPANVVTLAKRLGPRLGRVVVVATGYNDDPYHFDRDFDKVMRTLDNEGVRRVVWLTLREAKSAYVVSNADIEVEPKEWPTLRVADWNSYSAGRPDWFEADGVHLTPAGSTALAVFIHRTLRRTA
jgi:hypothetical protein